MDATTLAARQQAREAEGRPESLTELRERMMFSAGWLQDRADRDVARSIEEKADGWARGYWTAQALARRDAARMIESYVAALDVLIGGN